MVPYEFHPQQDKIIGNVARKLKVAAALLILMAVLDLARGVISAFVVIVQPARLVPIVGDSSGSHKAAVFGAIFSAAGAIVTAGIYAPFAFWTSSAGSHFKAITTTRGNDIPLLLKALKRLAAIYRLERTVIIAVPVLMILAFVGVVVAALVAGGDAVPMVGSRPRPVEVRCNRTCPAGTPQDAKGCCPSAPVHTPSPSGDAKASPGVCPNGMVWIGGGSYTMEKGSVVTVADYCLDKTEVTVNAYAACFDANACTEPDPYEHAKEDAVHSLCNWKNPGRGKHPINCIDWTQAQWYCAYAHKRLPTDEEWTWAARNGSRETRYPWGDQAPTAQLLNACGSECPPSAAAKGIHGFEAMYAESDGWPETAPVGSFPKGANRWGVLDLAGNVLEWTSTAQGTNRGARGGGWGHGHAVAFEAANRGAIAPTERGFDAGVRCAKSP
jgi:formylglycine-generating enzyme required for sulfatase activity